MTMQYMVFPFHMKAASEADNNGKISGYGSIFGNTDSYNEIVMKGAFAKTLNSMRPKQIKMLWQHDAAQPIGYWDGLKEDQIGLSGDAIMPLDIPSVKEAYQKAKAGLLDGLSIGYMVRKGGFEILDDNTTLLKDLDLKEISLVTFPANPLAIVSNVKNFQFSSKHLAELLIGCGFNQEQAKAAAARVFNGAELNEQKEEEAVIVKHIKTLEEAFKRGLNL